MKLIYISYPFGGDRDNLDDAEFLLSELQLKFNNVIFWAPWIPLCRYWPNEAETLDRGMQIDSDAIFISREFWMLSDPSTSRGMMHEMKVALKAKCFIERFACRADVLWLTEHMDSLRAKVIKERLALP